MSETLLRVGVRVGDDEAEVARALLLDLVPQGLEEVDEAGSVELVAYVDAGTARRITTAFPSAVAEGVAPGWEDAWQAFHRPVVVGGIWLGPPWERAPEGVPAVVIDPGRAFGTGAHPTTRLCVELLAGLQRGALLDVGCGSGVLAIAGARLGYGPLLAVDADPVAVEVARANVAVNGVDVSVRLADAACEALPRSDVGVANIALGPVERVLECLDTAETVTSGYLAHERPAAPRWEHVAHAELDGWAADHFRCRDRLIS
jgi:ribosomal protein L11 methyltransferase